jgi:zinc transport system permease protein
MVDALRALGDETLLRALAAGVGVAIVAGPLGCLIIWRRMAFFGDAIGHSGLLGVGVGFALGVDVTIGVIGVCLAAALSLAALQRQGAAGGYLPGDTLLGVVTQAFLALGLVVAAALDMGHEDLENYLFGDVLQASAGDLAWIWGGGVVALALLAALWRPLLALIVDEELALVEGVPVAATRLGLMALLALVVAVAIKIVGVLLVGSLLLVPAAAARSFASGPGGMAVLAAAIGCVAVIAGVGTAFAFAAPLGPAVVLAAVALFAVSLFLPRRISSRI